MDNPAFVSYKIEDRSYLSLTRRQIHTMVVEAGFNAMDVGEIDIVVSELTSNLVKHADQGGEILCRVNNENGQSVFEIFSIDKGPGITDIQRMIGDGISSSNTLGHGLGSINRLSDFFQAYSMRNWGTLVYARKYNQPQEIFTPKPLMNIKVVQQAITGETLCGDGYWMDEKDGATRIFLGDGLGHGPHAYDAVQAAIEAFKNCNEPMPADILRHIHVQVKKTRGLVATVAVLNHQAKKWHISGIGNISCRLYTGLQYKNYMPHNGIVGLNIPNTITNTVLDAEKYQFIVMCSDGIQSRWDLAKYTSVVKYDPAIIAAALFKDFARLTDDASVLVGKINY